MAHPSYRLDERLCAGCGGPGPNPATGLCGPCMEPDDDPGHLLPEEPSIIYHLERDVFPAKPRRQRMKRGWR